MSSDADTESGSRFDPEKMQGKVCLCLTSTQSSLSDKDDVHYDSNTEPGKRSKASLFAGRQKG